MYAMMCTRSDTSYIVGLVSRYQTNLKRTHWKAIKNSFEISRGQYRLHVMLLRQTPGKCGYPNCTSVSHLKAPGVGTVDQFPYNYYF
jgi:hypothetical protein